MIPRTREEAIQRLSANVCEVIFRKKTTGDMREMQCTLDPQHMPIGTFQSLGNLDRYELESDIVPVWDMGKSAWRSFDIRTIVRINSNVGDIMSSYGDQYVDDLIEAAEGVVLGYEKYLLDKLDYNELAGIMKTLRELLPFENYDRESE